VYNHCTTRRTCEASCVRTYDLPSEDSSFWAVIQNVLPVSYSRCCLQAECVPKPVKESHADTRRNTQQQTLIALDQSRKMCRHTFCMKNACTRLFTSKVELRTEEQADARLKVLDTLHESLINILEIACVYCSLSSHLGKYGLELDTPRRVALQGCLDVALTFQTF
jgi:hypothetical protein